MKTKEIAKTALEINSPEVILMQEFIVEISGCAKTIARKIGRRICITDSRDLLAYEENGQWYYRSRRMEEWQLF